MESAWGKDVLEGWLGLKGGFESRCKSGCLWLEQRLGGKVLGGGGDRRAGHPSPPGDLAARAYHVASQASSVWGTRQGQHYCRRMECRQCTEGTAQGGRSPPCPQLLRYMRGAPAEQRWLRFDGTLHFTQGVPSTTRIASSIKDRLLRSGI